MAGESPGREQQQESSGVAADKKALDPRLTVFRGPNVVPEAVREEHGGLSDDPGSGTDPRPEDRPVSSGTPGGAGGEDADSGRGSLPRQSGASASGTGPDTPDDVPGPDDAIAEPTVPEDAHDGTDDAAPADAPVSPAVDAPENSLAEPEPAADEPVDESVEEPVGEAADEPEDARPVGAEDASEASDAPRAPATPEDETPDEPAAEPEDETPDEPAAEPEDEPRDASAEAPAEEPVEEPAQEPVAEPVHAPAAEPADRRPEWKAARSAPADVPAAPRTESPAEPPRVSQEQSASPYALAWPEVERPVRPAAPAAAVPAAPSAPAAPSTPSAPAPAPKPSAFGQAPDAQPDAQPDAGPQGTRQMPLPPAPAQPLKLLAELTNTPPPPQTKLRTVVRRFKIWTPLVVLLLIAVAVAQSLRPLPAPALTLTSASSYTFQGGPLSLPWPVMGQSVVEVEGVGNMGVRGAQTPVPIASVTKVMTAYLILRDHPLKGKETGPKIKIDQTAADEAASVDESRVLVKLGQEFTERQMLELLLIPSGNNIARALARWDSGTQEAFVVKMQKAAADLGMKNTTYTGASGFEETTKSTAVDQLMLARTVMKNEVFRSVVAMENADIPGVSRIYNNNGLLTDTPGVIGIKTGSSTPAAGALMWAAQKTIDGKPRLILGVVLQQRKGSTPNDMLKYALSTSDTLVRGARAALASAVVVKKGDVVGYVDDGLGGKTPVVATKDLTAIGWSGLKSDLKLAAGTSGVPHSAKAGTEVGTLSLGSGTGETKVPVALQSDLKEPSFGDKLIRLG
ncbi:D-alanyl-D-alanine carboxypeptidase [Streptomyces fildesensis]|uniref:D-alanyl-D-alanine carboxypeptidase n=1 Tax=Streptomyces fildesensis TaxID=375757 RepID=UPI0018E03E16|nr:D-alanyl-D-alanine carboxypeptidase [Streptomyces fildesensis]